MAAPPRSFRHRSDDLTGTVLLTLMAYGLAVVGLKLWAQNNDTVHRVLDWTIIPLLAFIADHSPDFDRFMRRSTEPTWLAIEAGVVVGVLFLIAGICWMATARRRYLHRLAVQSLIQEQEAADIQEARAKIVAKRAGRLPTASDRPSQGDAGTGAARLKDIFRK